MLSNYYCRTAINNIIDLVTNIFRFLISVIFSIDLTASESRKKYLTPLFLHFNKCQSFCPRKVLRQVVMLRNAWIWVLLKKHVSKTRAVSFKVSKWLKHRYMVYTVTCSVIQCIAGPTDPLNVHQGILIDMVYLLDIITCIFK